MASAADSCARRRRALIATKQTVSKQSLWPALDLLLSQTFISFESTVGDHGAVFEEVNLTRRVRAKEHSTVLDCFKKPGDSEKVRIPKRQTIPNYSSN